MSDQANQSGLRYIIIGAGMSGMLAAIKLLERGESNFAIYEKGDSVGGTWRENTYPGLACDTPAHTYTNPSVAVLDFGGDKISTSGTFTIQFPAADASNAIIRIS